jgi:DNA-binding LacI/PurR family transcriptional regulator
VSALNPDFAVSLKKRMKICLELLPRHQDQVTTELRGASDMTVRQLDYLFKRGYRRIGYLHFCGVDIAQYPVQVLRLMDFYRIMAENGLRVDPAWVLHCSDHYKNLEAGMEKMLATDPKPEALIVPGGAIRELYSFCRKRKIRIGMDLAVFSCDDIHEKLVPEATVITNNPKDIAESFWEMFRAAERGEKVENRRTEFFIRTGQTVPNLKMSVK